MKNKKLVFTILSLVLVLVVLVGCFAYYNAAVKGFSTIKNIANEMFERAEEIGQSAEPVKDEDKEKAFLNKLDVLLANMERYYYDEVDMDSMYDAMLHAAVTSLGDPYSCYYSPEEFAELLQNSSGIYSGIGATISQDATTKVMTIVTPFTNSPAYNVGMRSGDEIIGVNGENVIGQDLTEVVMKIKGLEGTTVDVTVLRDNEEITFTITRAKINVEFVSHKMLDDNIGYILVSEFEETTAKQFNEAVDDLLKKGMKGLVVDIRNNPGGLYNIVCDMLDRILPKDSLLVYTENKYGEKAYEYAETKDTLDMPIVVIVNGNSASASEIFSGALQDYGKATIVGTQSFGKGIVQSVIPIYSDASGIKLTSSRYFTPNGVCIHGIGITPDVEVELEEGLNRINIELRDHDNQVDAAVEVIKKQLK